MGMGIIRLMDFTTVMVEAIVMGAIQLMADIMVVLEAVMAEAIMGVAIDKLANVNHNSQLYS